MVSRVLFSEKKRDWLTPKTLYDELDNEFHFKLDAATHKSNPLNTPNFYTEEDDALTKDWMNPTYLNPPYSRFQLINWIKKAVLEQQKGITTVMLVPARTDVKWFHDFIYNKPNIEIRFIKGRLKFHDINDPNYRFGVSNSAPFPSMLVIFR